MAKEYKKKHHVGLIILISFLTVFFVIPVGFFFIFIFDTSTKNVKADGTLNTNQIMSNLMNNAFNGLSDENPNIKISLGEDEFDQLLMNVAKDAINQPNYVPKMYCEINGTNYDFYMDVQASFLKSRVGIHTTLDKQDRNGEQTLVFKVNNISIGRCSFFSNLILNTAAKYVSDEMITKAFESAGINAESDLEHWEILYPESKLREDMDNLLVRGLGIDNMFNSLVSYIVKEPGLIEPDTNNGVSLKLKLESLTSPVGFDDLLTDEQLKEIKDSQIDIKNLNTYKEIITRLLENGTISSTDTSDLQNISEFLIKGISVKNFSEYKFDNPLKDEISKLMVEKSLIDGSQGAIENYKGDPGFNSYTPTCFSSSNNSEPEPDPESLDVWTLKEFKEFIQKQISGQQTQAKIKRTDINKFTKSLDLLGYTTYIINKDENNNYNVSYICLDNFNFAFIKGENGEDYVAMFVGININGCHTYLTLKTVFSSDADNKKINFEIKEIHLGGISKLTYEPKSAFAQLMQIIKTNINSESGFISFIEEKNNTFKISLDLSKLIDSSTTYVKIQATIENDDSESTNLKDYLKLSFTN